MGIGAAAGPLGFAMQGISMVMDGAAKAQGQAYEGAKAERAKQVALVQADQLDTSMRGDLQNTIANIRAIRAATGADVNSPTTGAYIAGEDDAADRNRRIKVGGVRMQATQYGNDAAFYRSSAKTSLLGGVGASLPYFINAAA